MGQGRAQHAAALFHRGDAFVVQIEAVEDQIDPGPRRVQCRLAPDRVRDHLAAEPMAFPGDGIGFVLRKSGDQLAVRPALDAVERQLDAIDAVLDLAPHLLDRLVDIGDQLADRGFGRADPGRVPVGQALMRRQIRSRRHHSRPVEQAGADRVADRQ